MSRSLNVAFLHFMADTCQSAIRLLRLDFRIIAISIFLFSSNFCIISYQLKLTIFFNQSYRVIIILFNILQIGCWFYQDLNPQPLAHKTNAQGGEVLENCIVIKGCLLECQSHFTFWSLLYFTFSILESSN